MRHRTAMPRIIGSEVLMVTKSGFDVAVPSFIALSFSLALSTLAMAQTEALKIFEERIAPVLQHPRC